MNQVGQNKKRKKQKGKEERKIKTNKKKTNKEKEKKPNLGDIVSTPRDGVETSVGVMLCVDQRKDV